MAIHHALLSLLDQDESYGYELRAELERSVGPQWGQLNIGHVYQLLERLKRDGMIEIVRCEPQPRRTERVIYAITDTGRHELTHWLKTPSPPSTGYRDDLYLKLVASARAGEATLRAVISREREALLGELHALRTLAANEKDPLVALLIDGAALQIGAQTELLDRAEHDSQQLSQPARQRGRTQRRSHSQRQAAG
ncbi:MAG: PadR family transcriptional regulator [Solirubrobacteraceae bacterium]